MVRLYDEEVCRDRVGWSMMGEWLPGSVMDFEMRIWKTPVLSDDDKHL